MKSEEIYKEIEKLVEVKDQLKEEIVGERFMFLLELKINELWKDYRQELKSEIVVECASLINDYE